MHGSSIFIVMGQIKMLNVTSIAHADYEDSNQQNLNLSNKTHL